MKKVLAIILAVCISTAALSGCNKNKDSQQISDSADKIIKIGVFEPFSGVDSTEGKREALGMEYANAVVDTVEINGQTYTIELWQSDNVSSATAATAGAYELIDEECDIVLGSYGTDVSEAAAGILADAGISMIGASYIDTQVIEENSNIYNISYDDDFEAKALASYALQQVKATAAYILTKNGDEMSGALGKSFKEAFTAIGATVAEGSYQDGNADFSDYFEAAEKAGAGVIFAPIPTEDVDLLFSQMSSRSIVLPLMSGSFWRCDDILSALQDTTLNVYIPTAFDESIQTDSGSEFVTAFKEWLNANTDRLADNGGDDAVCTASVLGYDAYMTAVKAIENADSAEPAAIGAALSRTTYSGVTGSIAFSDTGAAVRDGACILRAEIYSGTWRFETYQNFL